MENHTLLHLLVLRLVILSSKSRKYWYVDGQLTMRYNNPNDWGNNLTYIWNPLVYLVPQGNKMSSKENLMRLEYIINTL